MDGMLLLKASLLLSVTFGVAWLFRHAAAAARHRLWSSAFVALLALPLLAALLPSLDVPLPDHWRTWASVESAARAFPASPAHTDATTAARLGNAGAIPLRAPATGLGATSRDRELGTEPAGTRSAFPQWLLAWLAGTTAATTALVISLLRVRRLARAAEELDDPEWRGAAAALEGRLGLRRPVRLLLSAGIGTPMAGGFLRPMVFLPAAARHWGSLQRDVVLAHEIAHLAVSDPLRHVTARLAVALYWFHPLAWIAARHSAVSREQACDETVLSLGLRPSTYARVLLEMAECAQPSTSRLGALPMVEPSLLEKRVMSILSGNIRPAAGRRGLGIAVAGALLTLPIAAVRPAAVAHRPALSPSPTLAAQATAGTPAGPSAVLTVSATEMKFVSAPAAADDQRGVDRDSACWWEPSGNRTFSGNLSMSESGGRTVISEQVGRRGMDRVVQKSFGDLQLCMLAEGVGDPDNGGRPSEWLDRAPRVVIEVRRGRLVERLEVTRETRNAQRVSWQVGGTQRAFDRSVEEWRDRTLAVLDTTWELSTLRGHVSSLHGEISSIKGHESSLRGEISSLQGEVSSMRGHASSVQGEESTLRGEISSIQGHVSSLRGRISSEQGAISSLGASRYGLEGSDRERIAGRIAEHNTEIARTEKEIRDYDAEARIAAVERQIRSLDAPGKVAAIEADIRRFDLEGRVAAVERRIAELDVTGKVAAIERQIQSLDADRRGRELERRRDQELKDLEAAIAAIRD